MIVDLRRPLPEAPAGGSKSRGCFFREVRRSLIKVHHIRTFVPFNQLQTVKDYIGITLLAAFFLAALPVRAQPLAIDTLLARISTDDHAPYELTAAFTGPLIIGHKDGRWVGIASGTFHEWRSAGQPRRWKINIDQLDLPTLLRPFTGALRRAIEEKAAIQFESLETLHSHDLFILEELPGGRYVLGGIRHDIVDDAIDRYGHAGDKTNPITRRAIARWLYVAPTMHDWIVRRGGGAYALQTLADDQGLVHTIGLFYNWGQLDMTFTYLTVGGRSVWREVSSGIMSDIEGLGHVTGHLTLTFSQHRFALLP